MRPTTTVYEKTQFGWTSVLIVAAVMLFVYWAGWITDEPRQLLFGIEIFCVVVIAPLSTMTIRVTPTTLEWWFTIGLLRQRMHLTEIVGMQLWQLTFVNGFGYRVSATGALWRVSGSKAVLFDLASGKRLGLGTDEPERLIAAVRPLLQAPAAQAGSDSSD